MKRILYVEDDEAVATLVREILQKEGLQTEIAKNAKECFKMIKKEKYDLLLIDIMLPDMSGWELHNKLMEKNLKTKYAFISVLPMPKEEGKDLRKIGISDYINKPFEEKDLLQRIKNILN